MQTKYHLDYYFRENPLQYNDTTLIQLGRLHCIPGTNIGKHTHLDWYELTIITNGEGEVITNDESCKVSKGDIYLSFPSDFHDIKSSVESPLEYEFFAFNTKNPIIKKKFKNIVANTYICKQRIFQDDTIKYYVSDALAELSSKKEYQTEILSLLLEQILFLVIRNFNTEKKHDNKKNITSADELCFQIMHYIDTHIFSLKNLSVLSEKFNFNYSYLSKLFKDTTKMTLSDYYQNRKLETARLLIVENKLKITQISETLNYTSLYAFSKAFKNKYGLSPKHYSNSLNKQ